MEYNGEYISLKNLEYLPEGKYHIRLMSHIPLRTGPAISKSEIKLLINKRNWKEEKVIIENGNMPYLFLSNQIGKQKS